MLGLGLNLGVGDTSVGLPVIAGYRPLFYLTPYRDEVKTFSRASTATYIADDGDIESAAVNVLRNRDYSDGKAAILMEGQATNLCSNYNAAPTDLTGLSGSAVSGGHTTIIDDSSGLAAAGLSDICPSGMVIYVNNTSGGNVFLNFSTSGVSTDNHAVSVYSKMTSNGTMGIGGGGFAALPATSEYTRSEGVVTGSVSGNMYVRVSSGEQGYFILNQTELGETITSPIVVSGSAATRSEDIATVDVSGMDLSDGFWVVLKGAIDGVSGSSDSVLQLGTSSNSNAIIYDSGTSSLQAIQRDSGTDTASESFSYTLGDEVSLAIRYKADEFAAVWPDGSIALDTSASFVEPNDLFIAASDVSGTSKPSRVSVEEISIYPPDITPEQMRSALGV